MSETQHTQGANDDPDPEEEGSDDRAKVDAPSRNGKAAHVEADDDEAPPEAVPEASSEAPPESAPPNEEEPLLPEGNPIRPIRGLLAIGAGLFVVFCLMADVDQRRFGVPFGALGILLATFGVLDLVGSFDDPDDRVAGRTTLRALARPLALFGAGAFSLWGLVCLAVDGRLSARWPVLTAAALVPASFLVTVVGAYHVGACFGVWDGDDDGAPRPLLRRHGFWLIVVATLLSLPTLGSHSLSDPWETHYGEVAREMLARNDWISTWWAQDGWFWSKPVLDFWIQALAMATFGVRYQPDKMLSAMHEGRVPWPEWAVRLPVFLLALFAVYVLYKAVANVFGRRAGLLGGIVLLTMPQWFLLTHQTMTDMPFVAPMAAAMGFLLLGAHTDPDVEVRVYELDLGVFKLRFSGYHLVLGAIVACALPQILYLCSRNVLLDIRGFHAHTDAFSSGSPGNCGLPGNEACRPAAPVLRGLHPALQALIWAQALALVVYMNWGERRRQRLFFLSAWLFAALSTMAKGPAGFLLPALCALAYVAVSGRRAGEAQLSPWSRWRILMRLEIPAGLLILLCVALPWFVAMYARHGQPFTDRLLFHDMFKRAFTHVHDTNEGDDVSFRFYVWQLGYAMFPWTGLVPAGLVYWLRRREEGDRQGDASVFLAMWFVFAFSLFSLMLTKFHHYILPAIPPAAMLTGVLLDGMLRSALLGSPPQPLPREGLGSEKSGSEKSGSEESGSEESGGRRGAGRALAAGAGRSPVDTALYAAGIAAGTVALVYGATRIFTLARGPIVRGGGFGASMAIAAAVVVLGVGGLVATVAFLGKAAPGAGAPDDDADAGLDRDAAAYRAGFERALLGAAAAAGALLVFAVGRDMSASYDGLPNQIRLMHLVTYNYRRPWPPSLDFTSALWAFTAAAAALTFALVAARVRRHVVGALVALGLAFGAWGIDVYFFKISPHWGQRETALAYYQAAREAPGPVVAYQMNWKGENFYTGNHVGAFVSSGKKFTDYILEEKKKGVKTFYFFTEHGRTGTLSNELGTTREFEKLTTPELDNKFVLVRARFD